MEQYLEKQFLSTHDMCAFRIACVDGLSLDNVFLGLKDEYPVLLVSSEGEEKKFHIHGVAAMPLLDSGDDFTGTVRLSIKKVFPTAKGNKCLYVKKSKDKKQLLKYTLKEGTFKYQGFSKILIDKLFQLSCNKENLNKKIQDNEEDLLMHTISYSRFVVRHLEIIVSHNQNIYCNHVKSYFNKMRLKSGDISYRQFAEENFLL